jgi:hypothetical protein
MFQILFFYSCRFTYCVHHRPDSGGSVYWYGVPYNLFHSNHRVGQRLGPCCHSGTVLIVIIGNVFKSWVAENAKNARILLSDDDDYEDDDDDEPEPPPVTTIRSYRNKRNSRWK